MKNNENSTGDYDYENDDFGEEDQDWGMLYRLPQLLFGSFLTIIGLTFFFFTCIVIYIFFKTRLYFNQGSPIFVLSTWGLIYSSLNLLILGGYCGPAIFFQTYFPDSTTSHLPGLFNNHIAQLLLSFEFAGSLIQSIVAINRFFAVIYRKKKSILSRAKYNFIAFLILPISLALSYVPPNALFCCKPYLMYSQYTIIYDRFVTFHVTKHLMGGYYINWNPVWNYVNRPFYIITTIIPVSCYISIFGYHFYLRSKMMDTNGRVYLTEILRSVQFASIFIFYASSWLYYEVIYTYIIDNFILFAIATLFLMLEAIMNVLLQATMNMTIRQQLKLMISFVEPVRHQSTNVFSVQSVTPTNKYFEPRISILSHKIS